MDLHRLRIEVDDAPGCLGRALVGLGEFDIDVVEIDVHSVDGAMTAWLASGATSADHLNHVSDTAPLLFTMPS